MPKTKRETKRRDICRARKRSTVTADPTACQCAGAAHVVCRPGAWAGASVSALLEADRSAPPPLARSFDCGCHGAAHPVCEARWILIQEARAEAKPVRRMTLKQALKNGLTLRPHVEHTFTCPPGCKEFNRTLYRPVFYRWSRDSFHKWSAVEDRHIHMCACDTEKVTRAFCDEHQRGTTVREPIEGRG